MMNNSYALLSHYPAVAPEQHANAPLQSSGSSNSVANVVSSPLTVHQIARCFVYQYYSTLFNNYNLLHLLYDEDSQVNRLIDKGASLQFWRACGQSEIQEKFKNQLQERTTARIRIIEPQKSINDDIFVFIAGFLKAENQPEREFVQYVYLAKQDMSELGWYIKNEVFCFIDCLANDDYVETDAQSQNVAESNSVRSGSNRSNNVTPGSGAPVRSDNAEGSATVTPTSYEVNQVSAYEKQVLEEQQHAVPLDNSSATVVSETADNFVASPADSAKTMENYVESAAAADTGSKVFWQPVANQWESRAIDEKSSDPNWPKLGESLPVSNEQTQAEVQNDSSAYDTSSFAYKLMHNVRDRNFSNIQRGYAVSPSEGENANTATAAKEQNSTEEKKVGDSVEVSDISAENSVKTDRWICLIDLPSNMNVESIKRGIRNGLSKFNAGHAVEVSKPYVELNNRASVDYLLSQGQIWIKGAQFRVVPGNPTQSRRPRGSNRDHQTDSDRRTRGGQSYSNVVAAYGSSRGSTGSKFTRNPQGEDSSGRSSRGVQRHWGSYANAYGDERNENRQGGERRGRSNYNLGGAGRQSFPRRGAPVGTSAVRDPAATHLPVTPGVKSSG